MNIESATYFYDDIAERNVSIVAVINGKTIGVPLDPDNIHYQAIQEWVAEGNTIQEAN